MKKESEKSMKKNKNRRIGNNKGFSLAELIIAVAILAIAMIPMVRLFIVGAHTNGRAKKTLMATSVGQDIMEGLEAMKLKELAFQANYPSMGLDVANLGTGATAHELIKAPGGDFKQVTLGSSDSGEVVSGAPVEMVDPEDDLSVTSSIVSYDHAKSYYFKGNKSEYYFSLEGLKLKSREYDALISLTPSPDLNYADIDEPQITDLNTDYDAFYMENTAAFDLMVSRIQTLYSNTIKKEDVRRKITIEVTKTKDAEENYVTQATVLYQYTFDYNGSSVTYPSDDSTNKTLLYDNSENTDLYLRNLYLFYFPFYESKQTGAAVKDQIVVKNKDNVAFTLNLVKQKSSTDLVNLQSNEFTYKMKLGIEENTLHEKAYLKIRTNLDKNLYDESLSQPTQATYEYNGDLVQTSVKSKVKITDLVSTNKKVKLYDVNIKVYYKGAAAKNYKDCEVLAEMTGGMNN